MSTYRMLRDHWINGFYMVAGSTQTTVDTNNGLLPLNWTPSDSVEALDANALAAVYSGGPKIPRMATTIGPPVTYWSVTPAGPVSKYQLTGLGAALAPIYQ